MPEPVLAQSSAFELCPGGTCADPHISADGKTISCPPGDGCSGAGCYCQLFKRDKMASDDGAWHVAKLDHQNKAKHNPANNNYRCICVRPILEAPNCTIDGETYASRFVLCGIGECGLIEVTVLGGGGQSNKIKCLGNCAPGCKCTLFRLYLGGEPGGTYQPQNAKWERVAKVDTPVDPVGRYYYRCFCIK